MTEYCSTCKRKVLPSTESGECPSCGVSLLSLEEREGRRIQLEKRQQLEEEQEKRKQLKEGQHKICELKLKAKGGDIESQFLLGSAYDKGEGVEPNHTEAVFWYEKAAEGGNIDALYNLALSYERGEGVQRDAEKAVKLYITAANQGDSESQFNLGEIYEKGRGVEKDLEEAERWYLKAKENGDEEAEQCLIRIKAAEREREEERIRLEEEKKIREACKTSISELSAHSKGGGDYIGLNSSLRTQSEELFSRTAAKPVHEWQQEEADLIRLLLDYPKRKECLSLAGDSSEESKLILAELKKLNALMENLLSAQKTTTKASAMGAMATVLGAHSVGKAIDDTVDELTD